MKYYVEVHEIHVTTYTVEADSIADAIEKAEDALHDPSACLYVGEPEYLCTLDSDEWGVFPAERSKGEGPKDA